MNDMSKTIRAAVCVALVAGVAGCDEFTFDDPPTTDEEAYLALQAETVALRDETGLLSVTDAVDLPTTGTAQYDGTALIALDAPTGGTASELIGTAAIIADFANATVSGQADGFYGSVDGGEVTAFAGQIFLSQGAIDASGTGDQIGADVNGTLQGGGDTVVLGGQVAGNFLGDPLLLNEPPAAMVLATDDAATFTLNGAAATGGMEIVATN
jgi:hypothetical protein